MLRGKGSKVQSLEMPRTEWTICDKSCDGGQTCATEPALRGLRCGLRASVPSVLVPCPKAQGPRGSGLNSGAAPGRFCRSRSPGCKSCDAPGGPGGPGLARSSRWASRDRGVLQMQFAVRAGLRDYLKGSGSGGCEPGCFEGQRPAQLNPVAAGFRMPPCDGIGGLP